MPEEDLEILVVGGGIGGLSVALALAAKGRRVRVLEQAPQFGAIGYGIQLGPNVFPMFERLGIADQILAASLLPRAVLMYDALSGREVVRIPTDESFRRRFGHPYIVLHRVDLHNVLVAACRAFPQIVFEESAAVAGYEDKGDYVLAQIADGRRLKGALLIGADGLRSGVRARICGQQDPDLIGYVAHRTIVPISAVPPGIPTDVVALWGGPGFHIVHYPLRKGEIFNIVAVFETSTYTDKQDAAAYRAELDRTYRDAHPFMRALLAMMDLERRSPVADRLPNRKWWSGRAVVIGDAAHPTLQSLAQGACMAVEDAVVLAECLTQAPGHEEAFAAFEKARLLRTARVQLESRALWQFFHCGGIERDVRNESWDGRTPAQLFDCLGWLYDGFTMPVS